MGKTKVKEPAQIQQKEVHNEEKEKKEKLRKEDTKTASESEPLDSCPICPGVMTRVELYIR